MDKLVIVGIALIWLLALTWPKVDASNCVYHHGARVVEC